MCTRRKRYLYLLDAIILILLLSLCACRTPETADISTVPPEVPDIFQEQASSANVADETPPQERAEIDPDAAALYVVPWDEFDDMMTASVSPTLEDYASYLERTIDAHGAEITGDLQLWQYLSQTNPSRFPHSRTQTYLIAYPVSVSGREVYWGANYRHGQIYQWDDDSVPNDLQELEEIAAVKVFENRWVKFNYLEEIGGDIVSEGPNTVSWEGELYQLLRYDRQSSESISYGVEAIHSNEQKGIRHRVVRRTAGTGGDDIDTRYCDIYDNGFVVYPANGEIRIVTPQQVEGIAGRALNAHQQQLVDVVQAWCDSRQDAYEIIDIAVADFENTGSDALFASVAVRQRGSSASGAALYYVTDDGMHPVDSPIGGDLSYFQAIIPLADGVFFAHRSGGVSGWVEYLHGVKDGQVYETNISGRGMLLSDNEYGELIAWSSDFDSSEDTPTHTYKPYYFYLENGRFHEYGGTAITLEQIRALDPSLEIPEGYPDASFRSAWYRANGVIHINYDLDGNYRFLAYRLQSGKLTAVPATWGNMGVYLPAMMEDLATYPHSLPGG